MRRWRWLTPIWRVTRFRRRTFPSGTRICCLWRPRTRRRLSRRRCLSGRTRGLLRVSRLSPGFFDAFQNVIDVGTKPETAIELKAPFVEWSKTEIAKRGLELDVPYDMTWSCYRDEEPACGTWMRVRSGLRRSGMLGHAIRSRTQSGRSFRDLPVTKGLVFRGKYIYSSTDTG